MPMHSYVLFLPEDFLPTLGLRDVCRPCWTARSPGPNLLTTGSKSMERKRLIKDSGKITWERTGFGCFATDMVCASVIGGDLRATDGLRNILIPENMWTKIKIFHMVIVKTGRILSLDRNGFVPRSWSWPCPLGSLLVSRTCTASFSPGERGRESKYEEKCQSRDQAPQLKL